MADRLSIARLGMRAATLAAAALPELAAAHEGDHLHFAGSHTADAQAVLLGATLLALAAIGLWIWRSGR